MLQGGRGWRVQFLWFNPPKDQKLHWPTAPDLQHLVTENIDSAFAAVRRRRFRCEQNVGYLTALQCRPIVRAGVIGDGDF